MASGKSAYFSQKLLNQVFGGTAYSFPTVLYLALFSATPTATTSGTEATGTSYARVSITCNTTNWPAISGSTQVITNNVAFAFPPAGGNWSSSSNQTGAAFCDASTAGNQLYFGDLTVAKPVLSGDTASFAIASVTVSDV